MIFTAQDEVFNSFFTAKLKILTSIFVLFLLKILNYTCKTQSSGNISKRCMDYFHLFHRQMIVFTYSKLEKLCINILTYFRCGIFKYLKALLVNSRHFQMCPVNLTCTNHVMVQS